MGDHGVGHTAFKRINKFNDDKTEQVWELFREEFARASVAEDGETSWRIAAGIMSVDDINKQITEEDAATVISDIASSSSSSIQVTASWIENKDGKNQLTDTGVLLAKSAMYQILAKYREILLESLLVKDSEAYKIMLDLAKEDSRQAVPKFFEKMQIEHGQKARELETAYTAMIMLQQFIPNSEDADVLKDIRKKVKAGENQYPSFDAFDPDKHTATMFFKELEKVRAKLARIQKSADGPRGTGVQDDAIIEALIKSLEGHGKYDLVLFEFRQRMFYKTAEMESDFEFLRRVADIFTKNVNSVTFAKLAEYVTGRQGNRVLLLG